MTEEVLTASEVAEILKMSKAKAYLLLSSGIIPVLKIGSLVRVRKEDLEKYIRETARHSQTNTGK